MTRAVGMIGACGLVAYFVGCEPADSSSVDAGGATTVRVEAPSDAALADVHFRADALLPLPCFYSARIGMARDVQIGPFTDRTPYGLFITTEHQVGSTFRTICGKTLDAAGAAWENLPEPWYAAAKNTVEIPTTPIGVSKNGLIVPFDPRGAAVVGWDGFRVFPFDPDMYQLQYYGLVSLLAASDAPWIGFVLKRRVDIYSVGKGLELTGSVNASRGTDFHHAVMRSPLVYKNATLHGLWADALVWTNDNRLQFGYQRISSFFPLPTDAVPLERAHEASANQVVGERLAQAMFAAALTDLNADGTQDLVVLPYGTAELLFAPSDGYTFQPLRGTGLFLQNVKSLAVGHLNHDAYPDVAVANIDGAVQVYLAVAPNPRPQ